MQVCQVREYGIRTVRVEKTGHLAQLGKISNNFILTLYLLIVIRASVLFANHSTL